MWVLLKFIFLLSSFYSCFQTTKSQIFDFGTLHNYTFEICHCGKNNLLSCWKNLTIFPKLNNSIKLTTIKAPNSYDRNVIPSNINVVTAQIDQCEISTLEQNTFTGWTVKKLSLKYNKIKHIKEKTFKKLQTLETLSLSFNELGEMNTAKFMSIFQDLKNLTELMLSSNNLKQVPNLSKNNKLESIDFEDNDIATLNPPNGVQYLLPTSLQKISFQNNKFNKFDAAWISHVKRVKLIDLSKNMISVIDPSTFKGLYLLEILDLSFNRIRFISSRFRQIMPTNTNLIVDKQRLQITHQFNTKNIKTVNLIHNYSEVTGNNIFLLDAPDFCSVISEGSIDLTHFKLRNAFYSVFDICEMNDKLGVDFMRKTRLYLKNINCSCGIELLAQVFELIGECIDEINETIPLMDYRCNNKTQLARYCKDKGYANFNCSKSQLNSALVSPSFNTHSEKCLFRKCHCQVINKNLVNVDCGFNNEKIPVKDAGYSPSNVGIFQLSGNKLMGQIKFYNLSVQVIDLSDCYIEHIPNDMFDGINGLETLDLSSNYISKLQTNTFKPLRSTLRKLFLNDNKLNMDMVVLSDIISQLSNLEVLSLSNNNLKQGINLKRNLHLKEVSLSGNSISFLLIDVLPVSIVKLDLSNNNLSEIEIKSLYYLENLRFLDLSENMIQNIQIHLFAGLKSLTNLILTNQKLPIKTIANHAFERSQITKQYYKIIDLSLNRINRIEPDAFNNRNFEKCIFYDSLQRAGRKQKIILENVSCDCFLQFLSTIFDLNGTCNDSIEINENLITDHNCSHPCQSKQTFYERITTTFNNASKIITKKISTDVFSNGFYLQTTYQNNIKIENKKEEYIFESRLALAAVIVLIFVNLVLILIVVYLAHKK